MSDFVTLRVVIPCLGWQASVAPIQPGPIHQTMAMSSDLATVAKDLPGALSPIDSMALHWQLLV